MGMDEYDYHWWAVWHLGKTKAVFEYFGDAENFCNERLFGLSEIRPFSFKQI